MFDRRSIARWAVAGLGAATAAFALSLTGDLPGLWGLYGLAGLPVFSTCLLAASTTPPWPTS